MNNGRTTVVIKPTNDSYNRIRAIKYFGQYDYVTARNIHESLEFKSIKIQMKKYMRITILYCVINYFKNCDFIEIL